MYVRELMGQENGDQKLTDLLLLTKTQQTAQLKAWLQARRDAIAASKTTITQQATTATQSADAQLTDADALLSQL